MWEYLQTIILSFMIVLMLHFIYDYIKVNFTNEKHKNMFIHIYVYIYTYIHVYRLLYRDMGVRNLGASVS